MIDFFLRQPVLVKWIREVWSTGGNPSWLYINPSVSSLPIFDVSQAPRGRRPIRVAHVHSIMPVAPLILPPSAPHVLADHVAAPFPHRPPPPRHSPWLPPTLELVALAAAAAPLMRRST